ncbi:MAG: prolipoprotein diacylglyceryl transferase [Pseudomonadota bacterium]
MPFPNIDPVIITLGPFSIRWYSLAYIAGILFGWYYSGVLSNKHSLGITPKHREDYITYAVLGIIIGGRLGHVCLYEPMKYIAHPIEIFKTYEGGMSFHGGLLGIAIATLLFCRKNKLPLFKVTDLVSMLAPVGIFFGRIANFINAELYGRITDSPFAVIFPGSDMMPRHPSQLYEAGMEGLLIFCIMMMGQNMLRIPGLASGIFLILYSISRIIVEFFREPEVSLSEIFGIVTMGQLLSIPLFLAGLWIIVNSLSKARPGKALK